MGVISLGLLTEGGPLAKSLFLGSAGNNRLRKYLTGAKLGRSNDDISRYLGWRSGVMARIYTRMSNTAGSVPIPASRSLCHTPASHPSNLQCIV